MHKLDLSSTGKLQNLIAFFAVAARAEEHKVRAAEVDLLTGPPTHPTFNFRATISDRVGNQLVVERVGRDREGAWRIEGKDGGRGKGEGKSMGEGMGEGEGEVARS